MKKLILTGGLMLAATAAQAQWTNPNTHTPYARCPNQRPASFQGRATTVRA
ncbi:hypothetical protein [Bradyrhizobium tropiciagri]|uniref:hypothetical protein n=1 Tax=Bradyrhizobium tropiciagri TaxID=312253 RepID=UPI000A7D0184|nr:hypothetical protein [Bradyrhizobium tropiciagri]